MWENSHIFIFTFISFTFGLNLFFFSSCQALCIGLINSDHADDKKNVADDDYDSDDDSLPFYIHTLNFVVHENEGVFTIFEENVFILSQFFCIRWKSIVMNKMSSNYYYDYSYRICIRIRITSKGDTI